MTQRAPATTTTTTNGTTSQRGAKASNLIDGRFRGRCTGVVDYTVGYSSGGVEQVGLVFAIVEGEHTGRRFQKYWTVDNPQAIERLKRSLESCGWDGEDLNELKGIDSRDVELVVEVEEYDGKRRSRLAFVNGLVQATMKTPMVGEQRTSFLKSLTEAMKSAPGGRSSAGGQWDDESPEAHRAR